MAESERRSLLIRFLKRNMSLYAFWFVVLLPITPWVRDYFNQGLVAGLLKMLQAFLFYSTFRAFWYIIVLCTAMTVLYVLSGCVREQTMGLHFS